jgi:diguanylate cyclase (GGDEF)-like protein
LDLAISDVMSPDVVSVAPDCGLRDLATTMREKRLSCVVVCEEGRPVGIVSERDLVRVLTEVWSSEGRDTRRAGDVMSAPVLTLPTTSRTTDALELLQHRGFRRAPIVDDAGRLVGIVTQSDLLRAHSTAVERQRNSLAERVEQRTRELWEANKRLRVLSLEDPLLEIGNRRAMVIMLDEIHEICRRYGHVYSLVMFDVDRFKDYNDRYGHQAGDDALRRVAGVIRATLRRSDCLYRYGGEELVAVLPETEAEGGRGAAERARLALEALAIPHETAPGGVLTLSAGVSGATFRRRFVDGWNDLVASADLALYEAKRSGRNQVQVRECRSARAADGSTAGSEADA